MDGSRPDGPTHVKFLPTVTAFLRNNRTKPRQIPYTVILEEEEKKQETGTISIIQ